jgi:DNA-binding GntR family transcriptional regulator
MPSRPRGSGADPAEHSGISTGRNLYDLLRADVLTGEFSPGAVLQELPLSERYGVSRTPVREALARLEHDDLVERDGRGYRIRSGTPEDVLDIYEARIVLEGQAAAGAAERRTELDLTRLQHLHLELGPGTEPGTGSPLDPERARHSAWHATIWRAAHNRTIEALLSRLTAQLRIYDRGTHESRDDLDLTHAEHTAILEAIAARRPEEARAAMSAHLSRAREVRLHRIAQALP